MPSIRMKTKGVGDLTWLQASQLEAHLVCIVSQNTKHTTNTKENKGFAAPNYQKNKENKLEISVW